MFVIWVYKLFYKENFKLVSSIYILDLSLG